MSKKEGIPGNAFKEKNRSPFVGEGVDKIYVLQMAVEKKRIDPPFEKRHQQ